MEKRGEKILLSILFLGILFFSLSFISAALVAPTGLVFTLGNATSVYTNGSSVMFLNWTAGGGDLADVYTIFGYANISGTSHMYLSAVNTTQTGYVVPANTTQANYTFIVQVSNASSKANSTNISMYVDSTGPTITLPAYTNNSAKQNSSTLTLNISVVDSLSNLTGSMCIININGTNQRVAVSNGWCNTTAGYLNISDGLKVITVSANDTVNNSAINNSFYVTVDTVSPQLTFTEVSRGLYDLEFNITITDSDGTGVGGTCNASGGTISGTSTTQVLVSGTSLICGIEHTYDVTCYDLAGNLNTSSVTYTTLNCVSGSGSSGGSKVSTITPVNQTVNNTLNPVTPESVTPTRTTPKTQKPVENTNPVEETNEVPEQASFWQGIFNWFRNLFR